MIAWGKEAKHFQCQQGKNTSKRQRWRQSSCSFSFFVRYHSVFVPFPFGICCVLVPFTFLYPFCTRLHSHSLLGFFWVVLNVRWQWVQTLANSRGDFSRVNANYRKGTWIQSALVVSFHLFFIKVVHLSQMAGTLGNCCLIPFSKLQSWSIIMCLTLES